MAFCRNCGAKIDDGVAMCPYCGKSQFSAQDNSWGDDNVSTTNNYVNLDYDSGSIGWAFLGFFVPIVGLILFLCWNQTKPVSAKRAGMGALISVIINVLIYVLAIVAMILFAV